MPHLCRFGLVVLCAIGVGAFLVTHAQPLLADENTPLSRKVLDSQFREKLEALAEKCGELGMDQQARQTRDWYLRRASDRQTLFVLSERNPTKPLASADRKIHFWHERLMEIRTDQAEQLFKLAQAKLESRQATVAYQLLHEVVREDPEHAEALRILGHNKQSARPASARAIRTRHPLFDWPARKHWRVETTHFEISTNHSTQEAVELGQQLEDLYVVWSQIFFPYWSSETALSRWFESGGPAPPRRKHKVVLFRDHEEYQRTLGKASPGHDLSSGIYLYDREVSWLAAGDETAKRTWIHEATHQLFQETVPAKRAVGLKDNFWIVEAVALYMESMTPYEGYYTVGGFDALRLQFARYRLHNQQFYMPLSELTGIGRDKLQSHEEIRSLYTQSAGLAHFLIDGQSGRYQSAVQEYLKLMYAGRQTRNSLTDLTGTTYETLDDEYRKFLAVSDRDILERLKPPQFVTMLSLGRTDITDKSLKALVDYKQLDLLDLSFTKITDEGLQDLADLDNLEDLWLTGTAITDEGIQHLRGLKKLQRLEITGTKVTPEGYAALKRSLPALEEE